MLATYGILALIAAAIAIILSRGTVITGGVGGSLVPAFASADQPGTPPGQPGTPPGQPGTPPGQPPPASGRPARAARSARRAGVGFTLMPGSV